MLLQGRWGGVGNAWMKTLESSRLELDLGPDLLWNNVAQALV